MDFSNSVPPLLTRWRKIKRPTRSREIPKHFECWIVSFLVYGYLWLEKNKCSIPSPSSFFSILYGGSFEIISFRKPLWHIWFWNKIMSKSKVPVLIVSYLHVCIHATVHLPWSLDTADHTILLATGYIHNHFWLLHPPMLPTSQLSRLLKCPVAALVFEPRVAELHVTRSPESGTLTTRPSCLDWKYHLLAMFHS